MKKYDLSVIMRRAWELVKKAGMTISSGLKKAWTEAKAIVTLPAKKEEKKVLDIIVKEGKASIYSPYNKDFVAKIKKGIGGARWNPTEKCWIVPESAIVAVREIMSDVYGYTDVEENIGITLKITFNEEVEERCASVTLFGKTIARAYGRDSGARPGEDVAFVSGGVTSGGSTRNWTSIVKAGSIVILSNVNKTLFEKGKPEYGNLITIEVMEEETNKQKLMEEKERLLARIADSDKLIA